MQPSGRSNDRNDRSRELRTLTVGLRMIQGCHALRRRLHPLRAGSTRPVSLLRAAVGRQRQTHQERPGLMDPPVKRGRAATAARSSHTQQLSHRVAVRRLVRRRVGPGHEAPKPALQHVLLPRAIGRQRRAGAWRQASA
jgi:hypothetical protein